MLDKEKHQLYCDLKLLIDKYFVLKEAVRQIDFLKDLAVMLGI